MKVTKRQTEKEKGQLTLKVAIKFLGYLIRDGKKITFCGCLVSQFGDCKTCYGYLISQFH